MLAFSRQTGWAIQRYARIRYSTTSMTVYELMDAPCPLRTRLDVKPEAERNGLNRRGLKRPHILSKLALCTFLATLTTKLGDGTSARSWPRNPDAVVKFKTVNVQNLHTLSCAYQIPSRHHQPACRAAHTPQCLACDYLYSHFLECSSVCRSGISAGPSIKVSQQLFDASFCK